MMICLRPSFIDASIRCGQALQGKIFKAIRKLEKGHKSGYGLESVENSNKLYFYKIDGQNRIVLELGKKREFFLTDIWDHKGKSYKLKKAMDIIDSPIKVATETGSGFSTADFKTLELAFEAQDQIGIDRYFEKIREQIFPTFKILGRGVSARLEEDLGVILFPRKAEKANILNHPVVWLAFIGAEQGHYENHSQLTFHLGIGDCIHETTRHSRHFCIKLAVFHDRIDNKTFYTNSYNYPYEIIKYARKLDKSYEISFFRKRGRPPVRILPSHMNEDGYDEVMELLSQKSLAKGFYGFSFSRDYPYYDESNEENFSNITWVEDEIVNEFSNLMYLYFMFSENDPLARIETYKKRKIDFDNRRMSG